MFTIEKSVPMPKVRKNTVYPFIDMAVGDSFFVAVDSAAKASSIRACASTFGKKHSMKFTCKQVDGGVRVWRTE